ncbi:hypothetical protein CRM22_005389 [Opisthorchis felineus]|uniref:UPAR/Ly6 domain-containing protein n=1 Tax=Opisthorchis felineus TaxID=147828 RepID=A0A4S2LX63_OPIFE|nr:hypothetical protein CRM22_005389 [Opisthorchis felineus]
MIRRPFLAILILVFLIFEAVLGISCYTCQNCPLPIGKDTKVSNSSCTKCQITFKLVGTGPPTQVNATCKKTNEQCQPNYTATDQDFQVVTCCEKDRCNSMPATAVKHLPYHLSFLVPLASPLYSINYYKLY